MRHRILAVTASAQIPPLLCSLLPLALSGACASDARVAKTEPVVASAPAEMQPKGATRADKPSGVDHARFDKSVRPQDDFYRFVNGTWLRDFEIPADKSNYGSFTKLADEAEANLKAIIEEAAEKPGEPGSERQKIGAAYRSFLDESRADALGLRPLDDERAAISKLKTPSDVVRHFGRLNTMGIGAPLSMWVNQDLKSSTEYVVYLGQSGLGLPDRDYYFKTEPQFVQYRKDYLAYVEGLLTLAGAKDTKARAKKVLDVETRLAEVMWSRADNRDRDKTYNKKTKEELKALAKLDWDALFVGMELGPEQTKAVIVQQPTYANALGGLLKKVTLADWKSYLEVRLLDGMAPYLSKPFDDQHFAFHGKALSGMTEQRPRWKRGVSFVEESLGEAVGKLYVEQHFKPEAKARMTALVSNLTKAFEESIASLDWMSDATKEQARLKLSKFVTKIGYPDAWRDYSSLEIKADDLVGNVLRANAFEHRRNVKKLGGPIDRSEWFMPPQMVNAYYNPPMNEIVFPAAILQPPFFNLEADDAINYGAIGAVIGHELGHGFDDQGRESDGDGNLRDWWTKDDADRFKKKADLLVAQFNEYVPIDDLRVNGQLTLGENIGDLGGLNIAYRAYQLSLSGKAAPVLDGFTGDQRFFIGWAQIWGRKYRDEELRRRLVTDPHAPSELRVNGIVTHMPEFYAAFSVKEGDKLYRPEDQRVKIW